MMRGAIAPTATGSAHIQFASTLWDMADTAGARQELAAALEAAKREYVREDIIATMYFRLGEREKSIAWWQKSGESGGSQIVWLATAKDFAPLRTDPRIQAVIKNGRVP